MARNEEKAQSMLHRYLRSRAGEGSVPGAAPKRSRRPYLATLCEDVDDAERWRRQVLSDISRKVSDIQNPGLGESRTRELNDEINKHIREKRHWERRIRELGGQDYSRDRDTQALTDSAFSHKGYFYFGAARDLPGVRALLGSNKTKRHDSDNLERGFDDELDALTPEQLLGKIDPSTYFGYDDPELRALEEARETQEQQSFPSSQGRLQEADKRQSFADSQAWEQCVNMQPLTGKDLEIALARVLLEKRKKELYDQVDDVAAARNR